MCVLKRIFKPLRKKPSIMQLSPSLAPLVAILVCQSQALTKLPFPLESCGDEKHHTTYCARPVIRKPSDLIRKPFQPFLRCWLAFTNDDHYAVDKAPKMDGAPSYRTCNLHLVRGYIATRAYCCAGHARDGLPPVTEPEDAVNFACTRIQKFDWNDLRPPL
ncbi:hypothetical protein PSTT_01661 [Puccinia striiformis]|uniref:Uncharacterized protein n=1 Tax=Puccinia striiformis TaxID=27350 RepID=A0A2S4W2U5_9BASI|nr:hypothetical protein PSTT_01661 [Puccinia striiformis]